MSSELILPANPLANYLAHRTEIDSAIHRVLEKGSYIMGDEVAAFESEFARFVGVRHAVGVGSGTEALHLALKSCGIGPGDEVVTVAHTAVATVAAIELAGASPVLIDIASDSYAMDPDSLKTALSPRTKAILPVHLYGHPAQMDALSEFARARGLLVMEDCAQSAGASHHGTMTGALGDIASFSFYPTKNLGALGDGGMVVTDNAEWASRARSLREYGWRKRYVSEIAGWNSRLDELQAAILRVKLRHLPEENDRRRFIAERYSRFLPDEVLRLPAERPEDRSVFHQYVIATPRRDSLREHLERKRIMTLVHYPVPVHDQPAYRGKLRTVGDLARSRAAASSVLSLPMYPEISDQAIDTVVESILEWGRRQDLAANVKG